MSLLVECFWYKTCFREFISMNNTQASKTNCCTRGIYYRSWITFRKRNASNQLYNQKKVFGVIPPYIYFIWLATCYFVPAGPWMQIMWRKTQKSVGCKKPDFFLFHGYWHGAVWIPRNLSKICNLKSNLFWLSPFSMKLYMAEIFLCACATKVKLQNNWPTVWPDEQTKYQET